jgi:ferrochelatase
VTAQPRGRAGDALLLVSFGGPERSEDVVSFLENVTRGRGIPRGRLEAVGQHYHLFGGRSPINDLNRDLLAAVRADLAGAGVDVPVYWGNRNWDPDLTDVVAEMAADGVTRAACFVTSAYTSDSGCRQYRENLYDAVAPLGADVPRLDKLRHYFNHPGLVEPVVGAVVEALEELPDTARDGAHLVFVTHSIPIGMNERSGPSGGAYVEQHLDVTEQVAARVAEETGRRRDHALVYCSRSGPPSVPWLEPDVNDHLAQLAAEGAPGVVLVPVGFVADHMEVVYDLDTEAAATCERLGLRMVRAGTVGTDPAFVRALVDLVVERCGLGPGPVLDAPGLPSVHDVCPVGCCRNLRGDRPAACGADWAPPVVAAR